MTAVISAQPGFMLLVVNSETDIYREVIIGWIVEATPATRDDQGHLKQKPGLRFTPAPFTVDGAERIACRAGGPFILQPDGSVIWQDIDRWETLADFMNEVPRLIESEAARTAESDAL